VFDISFEKVAMQFYLVADMFPLRVWNAFGCFTETKME
jgi:hypothetical protein